MYTVEQHMREINTNNLNDGGSNNNNSSSNNNNTNSNNNNATENNSGNGTANEFYDGPIALDGGDTTIHLGNDFELPVFTEPSIITIQPNRTGVQTTSLDFSGENERAPMPVYAGGWTTQPTNHFVPLNGLDFLTGAETVVIQQTVELNDILSTIESENRYEVKVPRGETLYVASESSSDCQRACCGSSRSFEIKLYDHTRQLAIVLRRDLACGICWFGCCLQEMKVYAAQGQLIGHILQQWTLLIPTFLVINGTGHAEYQIEGPVYLLCNMRKTSEFKILSRDGTTQQGIIRHVWDNDLCTYNVRIDFPQGRVDREAKALLLGAGFLLEYMFFETSKRAGWRCCSCCRR